MCGALICSERKLHNFSMVSFTGDTDIYIYDIKRLSVNIDHFIHLHLDEFTDINSFKLLDNENTMVILLGTQCILYAIKKNRHVYYDFKIPLYDPILFCLYTIMAEEYIHIHSAGFFKNGQAYALMANSGTGKSSLLLGLLKSGAGYICDDQLSIKVTNDKCYAFPSSSIMPKYTIQTLRYYGINHLNLRKTDNHNEVQKYFTNLRGIRKCKTSIPLKSIYLIEPNPNTDCIYHTPVYKVNEYRKHFIHNELNQLKYIKIENLNRAKKIVNDLSNLNSYVDMYIIHYQKKFENMPALVDYIFNLE